MILINKYILLTGVILTLYGNVSGHESKTNKLSEKVKETEKEDPLSLISSIEKNDTFGIFLPKGYYIFEKTYGDLNKDGLSDCVLIIKATNKSSIVKDENLGELDRNRRGIIVLFKSMNGYELAVKNYDCFSSENEDGGVYYAPELSVEIINSILLIEYSHGRYGAWSYKFRFQHADFELIGYDASRGGAVTESETSINFLTKKKVDKINVNEKAEGGDEVFKETSKKINMTQLMRLSEIKDFDALDMSYGE